MDSVIHILHNLPIFFRAYRSPRGMQCQSIDTSEDLCTGCKERKSCQLPWDERVSSTQSTTHSPRLAIHVATLIATQEQRHARNLVGHSTALQRIQLSDLTLGAAFPGTVKHSLCHARLDETWADRIDPDPGASQLVRAGLGNRHNSSLGSRVIRRAGIGPQPGHRRSANNRAARVRLRRRGHLHRRRSVLSRQKDAIRGQLYIHG